MIYDYDAIVVGARCAGAATAMQLARGGMKVLVADRDRPGTDTMSTHALMRGAVIQLDRWGLLDRLLATGVPEVTSTRFAYGDDVVEVDIRPSHGTQSLIAPRRFVLDRMLAEAAEDAGAKVVYGTSFVDVLRSPTGRVAGATFDGPGRRQHVTAPIVIGADGRRSTVARRVSAQTRQTTKNATLCIYAYFDGLPNQGYRWYYRDALGVGAIPTHHGAHCIFASADPAKARRLVRSYGAEGALRHLVAEADGDLASQMDAGAMAERPVIYGGEPGFLRDAVGPGWALVGDAGYFKDPLTAHGITDAFRDAECLSRTILSGRPMSEYQKARDEHSQELFALTDRIAALDWSLEELKSMHKDLNRIMKAEQAVIAGETRTMPIAA